MLESLIKSNLSLLNLFKKRKIVKNGTIIFIFINSIFKRVGWFYCEIETGSNLIFVEEEVGQNKINQ